MINFLIARSFVSQACQRRSRLGFLHPNASHIFNSFSSVVKSSESAKPKQKKVHESSTVSYLMNSCGISPKLAFEVSKKVNLKDPDNPTLILNLFKSYGFSNSQISKIVIKHPSVLLTQENILLPKLKFFESIGFSRSEIPELLTYNIRLLVWSLRNRIIPGYEGLKSVIGDNHEMHTIISKRKGWHFLHYDVKNLAPNLKVLRELGVPKSSLNVLLNRFTSAASVDHAKFVEHVKFAKEIGVNPFRVTFIYSIHALSMTKKSTWESKLDIYERCGWSRYETLSAFRKFPYCMLISEEKITSTIKFLGDELNLSSKDIVRSPAYLGYNLKHRIIPRSSVFKTLRMKGLIDNDMPLFSLIRLSEEMFLEKFVFRFQESAPELLNIYLDQLKHSPEALKSSSV
ncbi:hypothetical protein QN277_018666 [Acacia crassicarpa]|uniref:Uncharacterized protein n=1 Tax=Acacia crassicarpa TaxID=499986 RepID=A0AAE1MUR1_9FABA|nr:hypothetical protein QN277_018666 [Acacia crassicarpa]